MRRAVPGFPRSSARSVPAPASVADVPNLTLLFERAREAVSRLPRQVIRPARSVRIHERGIHGRRRAGPGDSFWQFRHYHAGEPAYRIDWRRSARSEHLYVRQQEWETSRILWIACDLSASMNYRSRADLETKLEAALTLAFAAAMLGWQMGELIGVAGIPGRPFAASARRRLIAAFARALEAGDSDGFDTFVATRLPPHGRAILVSDFLIEPARLERLLARLVEARIATSLVRVEDPAERDFPFTGRVRIEGLEGEAPLLLENAGMARDEIDARLAAHARGLQALTMARGARLVTLGSDRPLADRVLALAGLLAP